MDGGSAASTSAAGASQQLLQRTWGNLIPVKVQLAADNVSSPARPQPLYVLVPRQGYLCTIASQAWPYFQHVLPHLPGQQGLRPWFDYQQLPLRGNIPVGALYDLLAPQQGVAGLPWELTIHYTGMPDTLAAWHNGLPMHTQFFHSLKEACFVCKGPDGAAAVMKMNGASQDALWAAIERAEAQKYASALNALRTAPVERQGVAPAVPVRLLVRAAGGGSSPVPTAAVAGAGAGAAGGAGAGGAGTGTTGGSGAGGAGAGAAGTAGAAGAAVAGAAVSESAGSNAGGPAFSNSAAATAGALPSSMGGPAGSWDEVYVSSRPVAGVNPDGSWTTLGQALQGLLPGLSFRAPSVPAALLAQGEAEGGSSGNAACGDSAPGGGTSEGGDGRSDGAADAGAGGAAVGNAGASGKTASGAAVSGTAEAGTAAGSGEEGGALQQTQAPPESGRQDEAQGQQPQQPQQPLQQPAQHMQGSAMGMSMFASPARAAGGLAAAAAAAAAGTGYICEAIVGGVVPPLDTPVAWLHANLHAPDYFLYVTIRRCSQ